MLNLVLSGFGFDSKYACYNIHHNNQETCKNTNNSSHFLGYEVLEIWCQEGKSFSTDSKPLSLSLSTKIQMGRGNVKQSKGTYKEGIKCMYNIFEKKKKIM